MRQRGALLTGLGLALAGVYLLNPARGPQRRARLVNRVDRAARIGGRAVAAGTSRLRHVITHRAVDDEVLLERVRAGIEDAISHPYAIEVEVDGGVVTLRGPILQWEVDELVHAVAVVPGVRQVIPELEIHKMTWNVPALQGGRSKPAPRPRRDARSALSARR